MRTTVGKVLGILGILLITVSIFQIDNVSANPLITKQFQTERKGSNYWETSAIREWLNSERAITEYTNKAPASNMGYEKEGFLREFSESERNAIAVTQRRSFVHSGSGFYAREGGTGNSPRYDGIVPTDLIHLLIRDVNKTWRSYYHRIVNDKVFLLSHAEMYEYVQKRGKPFKRLTTENRALTYGTDTPSDSSVYRENRWVVDGNGKMREGTNSDTFGVVPAVHLKPTDVVKGGKKAKDLAIDEEVEFGTYKGKAITWEVVNKTSDGYVLLW